MSAPAWVSQLTDDDEWIVRTALSAIASDMDKAAAAAASVGSTGGGFADSAQRYRETLARIEMGAGGADE